MVKIQWELIYKERDANLFPFYVFAKPFGTMIKDLVGRNLSPIALVFSKKGVEYYVNHEEFKRLGEKVFELYMDKNFYINMVERIDEYTLKITEFCEDIEKLDLDSLNESDLKMHVEKLCMFNEELDRWGQLTSILEYGKNSFLTDGLMKEIDKQIKEKKLDLNKVEVSKLMSQPVRSSYFRDEKIALMKLAVKVQQNNLKPENIIAELEDIKNKYCWILFGYVGPAITVEDLKKEISSMVENKDLEKELEEKQLELDTTKKAQQEMENKLDLNEYFKMRFRIVREQTFYKEHRKEVLFHSFYVCELIHEALAKRYKLDKHIYRFILPNEYHGDLKLLYEQRKKLCIYYIDDDHDHVLVGDDAEKILAQINTTEKKNLKRVKELKGQCAFAGKVKGKVKIIMGINHLEKLEKGDILVSYSTNPQMTIAMYKAGAVITEQGGIASHAAIVSREMKIPCLVGVQGATETLSDGDKVEVDATNGIIKIIEKAD